MSRTEWAHPSECRQLYGEGLPEAFTPALACKVQCQAPGEGKGQPLPHSQKSPFPKRVETSH